MEPATDASSCVAAWTSDPSAVRARLNPFSHDPQVARFDGSVNGAPDVGNPACVVLGGDAARVAFASHHDHALWSVHLPTDRFNGGWKICTAAREDRDRD